jgi:hypothetical protein
MDEIIKKLTAGGVSADMIEKLKSGLGDNFESSIATMGLKGAAEKLGLDTTNLPDIDFKNLAEAAQELMGKDVDGDGKTGISEAVENAKEAMANTDMTEVKAFAQKNGAGIIAKIKSFFVSNNA